MKAEQLIGFVPGNRITGSSRKEITGVTFDSRQVTEGALFVAIRGIKADGHAYIGQACEQGAACVVCEQVPEDQAGEVTWVEVEDSRMALAQIASAWHGHPSRELRMGYRAGLLSTIEVLIGGRRFPATHTTPDPMRINGYLREMVDAGCEFCFMEVSSHAVSQKRIAGLQFDGAVFTNLTHDHLDYHGTFRKYLEAKKEFFDGLEAEAFALVNSDDKNGEVMLQNCAAEKYRYGLRRMADFRGRILEPLFEGSHMEINGRETWIRLPGTFNASNILAIYGVSVLLGHAPVEVLEQISALSPVPGRFETLRGDSGTTAVVDFAHTDDALENVLQTIRGVNRGSGEIIVVVGAGGDRDRTKRPKMGAVAAKLADKVILTSDNPRSESPEAILAGMEEGIPQPERGRVMKITDREEAIKTACMLAREKDVILVAGKGHEKTQEIMGVKHPFDDTEVIRNYLK